MKGEAFRAAEKRAISLGLEVRTTAQDLNDRLRGRMPKEGKSIWDRYPELKKIPRDRFPHHVLIIPDGNGRWAELRGKSVQEGHAQGKDRIVKTLRDLSELGGDHIRNVTTWGASTNNLLDRPPKEVAFLLNLFDETIVSLVEELIQNKGRFVHLGNKELIQDVEQRLLRRNKLVKTIREAEEATRDNTWQIICAPIGFDGTDQERRMIERAINLYPPGTQLTHSQVEELRDSAGLIPPADLIIRTGEERLSDIGWLNGPGTVVRFRRRQLFPDLRTADVVDDIKWSARQKRNFGGRPDLEEAA